MLKRFAQLAMMLGIIAGLFGTFAGASRSAAIPGKLTSGVGMANIVHNVTARSTSGTDALDDRLTGYDNCVIAWMYPDNTTGVLEEDFAVNPECEPQKLTLISYRASSGDNFPDNLPQQKMVAVTYTVSNCGEGFCVWKIPMPKNGCFYQVDFVHGPEIDNLSQQHMYGDNKITWAHGGTHYCAFAAASIRPPENCSVDAAVAPNPDNPSTSVQVWNNSDDQCSSRGMQVVIKVPPTFNATGFSVDADGMTYLPYSATWSGTAGKDQMLTVQLGEMDPIHSPYMAHQPKITLQGTGTGSISAQVQPYDPRTVVQQPDPREGNNRTSNWDF